MRKLLLVTALVTSSFAFEAEVKSGDIELIINDKLHKYKKGSKFTLKSGTLICYKDGDGRVVIVEPTLKNIESRLIRG
jgi:hypothetical protein